MGHYHVAQICINGHMVNDTADTHPDLNTSFCSRCGAKTITTCPSCRAPIHGDYDCGIIVLGSTASVDAYCYQCGKPYPWTESALQSTALLIQEEESLSEQSKVALIETLPDIVSETPKTNLAVVRVKKCIASAGRFTGEALRQFVIDFGCELAKKALGL